MTINGRSYSVMFDGLIANPESRALLALKPKQSARLVVLDGEKTFSGKRHEAAGSSWRADAWRHVATSVARAKPVFRYDRMFAFLPRIA